MRCPECSASEKVLVRRHDGRIQCLGCGTVFSIDGPVPKLYIKSLAPAKYLGERVRSFVDLTRPLTIVAAGVAGFFLVLLGSALAGSPFHPGLGAAVGLILAALQGGSQAMNQGIAREAELDRANGKIYRPVVRGAVSPDEAKLFALALIGTAVGFSFALGAWFGLSAVLISFFGVFYSAPPVRAKYRFLVSDFWQAASRGCLPFLAVCYGLLGVAGAVPLALSAVVMLFVAGLQATKDFPDMAGDREFGVPTLPVRLGRSGAVRLMSALAASAFALLGALLWAGILPGGLALLFVLAVPTGAVLATTARPAEHRLVENTVQWAGFYAILGMFYVLPPLALLL